MYRYFLKNIIDRVIAFILLLLLSPLFICIMLLIFSINGRNNIFFLQKRPGKSGKIFNIIKFKTMTDGKDKNGKLYPDAQRLNNFGKFVRLTSIDELPQLINVLKGNMSFIGPRPLLPEYLQLYDKEQFRRHEVKPGITGWAQINGRNTISWRKKFELDVWYVDHCSFLLDIKIVFFTIKKVLKHEGISSNTSVTVEAFNGNN